MNNLLFYRWETGTFGPCSSSCGGGERVRPVRCVQKYRVNVVKVPDSECLPDSAPNAVEKCNPQFCPARYKILFINLYFFKSPLHGLGSNNLLSCCNIWGKRFYVKTNFCLLTDGVCQSQGNVQ